jgi:hypothetical protein
VVANRRRFAPQRAGCTTTPPLPALLVAVLLCAAGALAGGGTKASRADRVGRPTAANRILNSVYWGEVERQLQEVPKRRILRSWKEIAQCLNATVRSAQRWEKSGGLPVHRQGSGPKGRVFAYSDELLEWMHSGRERDEADEAPHGAPAGAWRRWILPAAGVAAVLAVAGFLFWQGLPPFRRVPGGFRLEGSRLVVLDARGRVCWQKEFAAFDRAFEVEVRDKVLISDIDGDGRPEALFNFLPDRAEPGGGSLLCGSTFWTMS